MIKVYNLEYRKFAVINDIFNLDFKWDTGCSITIVRKNALSSIFGPNVQLLSDNDKVLLESAFNTKVPASRYMMRNVTIENMRLKEFRFLVPDEAVGITNLLGADFKRCCKGTFDGNVGIEIQSFDADLYDSIWNVIGPCQEVCHVQPSGGLHL